MFDELSEKICINKIGLTGGEPTFEEENLFRCLDHVRGRCGLITVNTNGSRLKVLEDDRVERISISRHHFDNEKNDEIFGVKIGNPLVGFSGKKKVILSCNLIRGYVDSVDGAYGMLDFAAENGISEVAFVGLMKNNDFSKENIISPSLLNFGKDVLKYRELSYHTSGVCECSNHSYVSKSGKMVMFFMRHTKDHEFDKGSRIVWANNRIM